MTTPDDIARFSNRAMLFNTLETSRRKQIGFWLFYRECCGRCNGSGFVENILTDVTAVEQEPGGPEDGPDILLHRKDNRPPLWLIFSRPDSLPIHKIAHCMGNGVDVFELEAGESKAHPSVTTAHIASGNCRDRKRKLLEVIWERLRSAEVPLIGIREDLRSEARKQREYEEWRERFDADMSALESREAYCTRCGGGFAGLVEGSYSSVGMFVHRPEGECGEVSLCDACHMELMGGMTGERLPELAEWSSRPGCPACEAVQAGEMKDFYAAPKRKVLEMPEHTVSVGSMSQRIESSSTRLPVGLLPRVNCWPW